jgi:hypothetical protein
MTPAETVLSVYGEVLNLAGFKSLRPCPQEWFSGE